MENQPTSPAQALSDDESQFEVNQVEPGNVKVFETTADREDDDTASQKSADWFARTSSQQKQQPLEPLEEEEKMEDIDLNGNAGDVVPNFSTPDGTILEAAFVDPAYSWPPKDGEGRNAIELQASLQLLNDPDLDTESVATTETEKERMALPDQPIVIKKRWWQCCRNNDAVDPEALRAYQERTILAKEARRDHIQTKREKLRQKEKEHRRKHRYNRIPEGILIYRLDTSTHELSLMSDVHSKTNLDTVVQEMTITKAKPSPDKSRRGLVVTGADGTQVTLVACEQRTATAWLEAINLMLAKGGRNKVSLELVHCKICHVATTSFPFSQVPCLLLLLL